MDESLLLFDAAGNEYLSLSGEENRRYTKLEDISDHVKQAFLSTEDVRFYDHNGIDIVRIFGALWKDIKSGSLAEGASTITQQLVKTSVLTPEKTLSRKLSEAMMAIKTEQYYAKDEILELYLNRIYFGNGAYGIEAASLCYFGKPSRDLTLSQAAALVGVVKSPTNYAPHINLEKCTKRRNIVLAAMLDNGCITKEQYENALCEPIEIVSRDQSYPYGYYTDYTLICATELLGISMDELLRGGYRIHTALDTTLQRNIEACMTEDALFPEAAADGERVECAVVALDAQNNLICAMTGGRKHETRLAYSRATDMQRQPGSAIKPILVFAPAVEFGGYTTTSFVLDQPMEFAGYAPRNSGSTYQGWITLREVAAHSVNIPSVCLMDELGIDVCKNYAQSVGIRFDDADNNLSLALGGFTSGVTPLSLASAYTPFANGGKYTSPSSIEKITNAQGTVLYEAASRPTYTVLSEENAFIMTSMLSSVVEYGTATSLYDETLPLAAKTGTTTYDDAKNNRDAWVCAYNREYVICTWMGFDSTDNAHFLPKGTTGGTYPAALTKRLFDSLYEEREAPSFSMPSGVVEVSIDASCLKEDLKAVPALSSSQDAIVEYYTERTAPRMFENDDQKENIPFVTFSFRNLR